MQDTKHEERGEQPHHIELTTICIVQGLLNAQVIEAKLEQAGIPVLLRYESIGPVMGITVDGLGEVRIQVPVGRADEAQVLIEER